MSKFRKVLTAALSILTATVLVVTDFAVPVVTTSMPSAHADDDDGGGRDGGRGGKRGGRYDDDDDRPALFRKKRLRPRRVVKTAARPMQYEPDILVVQGLSDENARRLTGEGYRIVERHRLSTGDAELVKLRKPRRLELAAARQAVQDLEPAATVDFNHYYRPESDECSGDRCLVRHIAGWPTGGGNLACRPAQPVGLIDTQINADHPSLKNSRIISIPLEVDKAERSGARHGTAVAALLVGKGGVTGLLPGWDLVAVDAFRKGDIATGLDLVRAIDVLMQHKVGVINMSLSGPDNAHLRKIIAAAGARDIVLVAAAGNDGPRAKPSYPAAYPMVLAVTAVGRNKRVYHRAAQGAHIDIAAPGVNVWTAASIDGQRPRTGTSFAAPFVSAAVALIKANNPGFSTEEVVIVLENQADDLGPPGRDDIFGWGLLDIRGLCRP